MPYDSTQDLIFPPELITIVNAAQSHNHVALFGSPEYGWLRPTTVEQLVALRSEYGQNEARLVFGNTEVGKQRP